jgi:8-oxo-dGTP pyrophosphatase MutT (NUDIX family)
VLIPSDPADRPRRSRATVRVLLVDDRHRLLLFQDSDDPVGALWWMLPGGGIDPGETELAAVVRELGEETGLVVDPAAVLGPLARRHVVHGYSNQIVDQDEAFYAVRVPPFEVDVSGHTDDERRTVRQHRWWTRAELSATGDEVWPVALTPLWDLVDEPAAWPRELGTVEESTVPAEESTVPAEEATVPAEEATVPAEPAPERRARP